MFARLKAEHDHQRKTCSSDFSKEHVFACQAYPALLAAGQGWFAGLGCPLAEYAASLRFQTSAHPTHKRGGHEPHLTFQTSKNWWSLSGSNRRPEACKATALPAELRPRSRSQQPRTARSASPTGRPRRCAGKPSGRRSAPAPEATQDNGGPGTTRTSDLTLIRGAL